MKTLLLLIFILQCLNGMTQRRSTNFVMTDDGPFYLDRDLSASAAKYVNEATKGVKIKANIEGTAFLHDEWNKGYVRLENDRVATNQDLRYNVYNNKLYFLKDSQELVLTTPTKEFGYSYCTQQGSKKEVVFRNGYRRVNNNTEATFYEVLVDKDLTLLKQYIKKVIQTTFDKGTPIYRVMDVDLFYVYDSKKNFLFKIKKDLNSVLDAMPQQAERIKEIVQSKNPDLKSQDGLVTLFQALNQ